MVSKAEIDKMARKIANDVLNGKIPLNKVLNKVNPKLSEPEYNSNGTALRLLSEEDPKLLYNQWDFFHNLLSAKNNYLKMHAIYIISNLCRVDKEEKFEYTFEDFYDLLDGESLMIANHTALVLGKIAKVKPKMREKVTEQLLSIDSTHWEPKRKDLIKGYAIKAIEEYITDVKNKEEILNFVSNQMNSNSPTTKKEAIEFLKKFNKNG
jgi:DNA-directed RNA polymerase subunit F